MGTTLRKTHVMRFSPSTTSDALDANDAPPGACTSLVNLIPDPSTRNLWAAKPTAITVYNFTGSFSNPGTISVFKVVGDYIYGLIASSLNAGKEQPFCLSILNIFAPLFITVNNITSANVPTVLTQPPPWQPVMEVVGNKIIVTHPGFDGAAGRIFGVFDISLGPSFPIWYTTNLTQTGGITADHVSAGGANYNGGTAGFHTVALGGGTGAGASASVFVHATTGVIDNATIVASGAGYTVGDVLTVPAIGGLGAGATVTVDAVQTTGAIAFTGPPQWVAQFYQRAYFGDNNPVIPAVVFTDILSLGCTNANQALTFGDNLPTVMGKGMGLNNQLGGIVQSLMVFKYTKYIIQITGDAALSTLATNTLNVATGITSSRGVVGTSQGLAFAAPDGIRIIDFTGNVSDPIGEGGQGVTLPFSYGVNDFAYHVALGYNRGVIRASLEYQYPDDVSSTQSEFWYTEARKCWSGPHATAYAQYSNYGDGWIVFRAVSGQLTSLLGVVSYPKVNAGYNPNANVELQTVMMYPPDVAMSQIEITQLTIWTTAPSQVTSMIVKIIDQDGNTVVTRTFTFNPATTPSTSALYPRRIDYHNPAVVTRFAIDVSVTTPVTGLKDFKIGDIYIRYRDLDYLQQLPG